MMMMMIQTEVKYFFCYKSSLSFHRCGGGLHDFKVAVSLFYFSKNEKKSIIIQH